jgi:hypothetical protein
MPECGGNALNRFTPCAQSPALATWVGLPARLSAYSNANTPGFMALLTALADDPAVQSLGNVP